ncbi:hypothetical protein C7B61_07135 [filamentous cyanobacterium CCP1]|nr:hypothetical protein C7B76_21365 [filamentous cyanobacterium CCP2]PSB67258.1 hypothetical protein C7B61_07135 [filamentous cyanobacterium CCP1]
MQVSLLLLIYFLNVLVVASILLWSFFADRSTPKNHKLSWAVVVIASVLWFIAVPLSIIEILRKLLHHRSVLRDQNNPSKNWG